MISESQTLFYVEVGWRYELMNEEESQTESQDNRRGVQKTQTQKTQTSKTQTSQFKTSLKTYTFDENSLRIALIFPIVYGYWRADLKYSLFWNIIKNGKLVDQQTSVGAGWTVSKSARHQPKAIGKVRATLKLFSFHVQVLNKTRNCEVCVFEVIGP